MAHKERSLSRWCRLFGAVIAAALLSPACDRPEPATLVLRGGKVVTMDPNVPLARAIAVRDDRLVAVGSDETIASFIGPKTEVVELEGRMAMPGFIETHGHLMNLGNMRRTLDLTSARSWDEIVARVREAADKAAPGEWIVGRGWHQEKFDAPVAPSVEGYPTNAALNTAAPANPVVLRHAAGNHALIANDLALQAAGISNGTADPEGGRILRERSGRATGILIETAVGALIQAMEAEHRARPAAEIEAEAVREIELAQDDCIAKGVTSFHDAGSSFETVDRLRRLAAEGRLKLRLWVMLSEGNAQLRERLASYRIVGEAGNHLTVRAIKHAIDGALGSRGAWLLEPYSDDPSTVGLNTTPIAEIEETARLALEHGFQLCVHAIGDRANREVLNLYQRAFAGRTGAGDLRWRVEHAQLLHPADVSRFAGLGVVASMQGIHCTSDGPWVPARIGPERARDEAYVWKRLFDANAVVTNGSDTPVEDVDPIVGFHASVTRRMANGEAFFPEQRMRRDEALGTYTRNAAYAAFEEDFKGMLKPGLLADIVVLSQDLLTVPDERILETKVLYTIVGGQILYRRSD